MQPRVGRILAGHATGTAARHVDKVLDLHRMSFVWGGIAISRNNDTLLFSGLDHLESDIMLVEGFQ